jgi:hypothetical protein
MKTKTITQTGIRISGIAFITLWDNNTASIEMNKTFIPNGKITKTNILSAVNDGRFGCQSIDSAEINISITYDNGSIEYDRTLFVDNPIHTQFFGKRGI